jgi:hypothetical protein
MNTKKQWSCPDCGHMNDEKQTECKCGTLKGDAALFDISLTPLDELENKLATIGAQEVKAVAVVPPTPLEPVIETRPVPKSAEPVDLIATNPQEMRHAQHALIDWVVAKLEVVKGEIESAKGESSELAEALAHAKAQNWKTSTIGKHHDLAIKRIGFAQSRLAYYTKIMTALQAGYYIVPPMDMELFAIRTDKEKPARRCRLLSFPGQGNFEMECQTLPMGVGDYKNPHPKVEAVGETLTDDKGNRKRSYAVTDWDAIDFPVNMIKPKIMEATDRAMALKVFDEMGVLPQDYRRNPDPVILGRIYQPKKNSSYLNPVAITFMIAWHLNTKDL